ncbi:Phosphatidylinositide phosphatase SAC1 [Cladochytrium tenue]|nr:Phosphatidylinositide phosphatase SAC1 [Cladochytrium tenue]
MKTTFRVFRLHDGRVLVESPLEVKRGSRSPADMLVLSGSDGDFVDITLDQELLETVKEIINSGHLYYSKTYDLTHSIQHNYLLNTGKIGPTVIDDSEGNAANNVEMEQIVFNHDIEKDHRISSFVQIRGSAPAIWGQELNLDYRPELLIVDTQKPEVWRSIELHLSDLQSQYVGESVFAGGQDFGKVICVNLLDDKGFEGSLTETYRTNVERFDSSKVTYEEFPVNKWCKKMNFRNMDILLNRVRDRLINSQFFTGEGSIPVIDNGFQEAPSTLKVSTWQTGLARVSCLDSLDRTNLTCSIFARYMIAFQLDALINESPAGAFKAVDGGSGSDVLDPVAETRGLLVESSIRTLTNLWADSGDAISLLYAGTRALKADVTRTGRRQWLKGSLDDGLNSLTRYYLNNFSDGRRQDGYDLWSGKVTSDAMATAAQENDDVKKRARHLAKPILQKGKGLTGWLLPGFVIDRVEPLLQAATEFASSTIQDQARKAQRLSEASKTHLDSTTSSLSKVEVAGIKASQGPSYVGFLVSAIKIYAPERVTNVVDFMVAMVVFFYILVIVKVFQLNGQLYVGRPKLTYEHKTIAFKKLSILELDSK